MSRSKWKGPFLKPNLINKNLILSNIPRNSIIPASYLNKFTLEMAHKSSYAFQ